MKILSTKVHGILDYLMGILLVALPWILGFNAVPAATWTLIFVGAMMITLALFTNYEAGIVRSVPMASHLYVDMGTGLLLAISPWLFGFADQVYQPHLVLGIVEILAALVTSRHVPDIHEDEVAELQQKDLINK